MATNEKFAVFVFGKFENGAMKVFTVNSRVEAIKAAEHSNKVPSEEGRSMIRRFLEGEQLGTILQGAASMAIYTEQGATLSVIYEAE